MGSPCATLSPQACHVEGGSAGLVPSQLLEEKRKAFVKRDVEVPPASGTVPTPPRPPQQCPRAVVLSPASAQASPCPRQGPCVAASAGGGRRG